MNYDIWAEWYDVVYSSQDSSEVDFYAELARSSGGPVLEIGCGTGRIIEPTSKMGVEVVGIDINQQMLERAVRKLDANNRLIGSVELIRADMRCFYLKKKFPLVTIPARTLLLATTSSDQTRTLRNAAAHLSLGGKLAFNVFVPEPNLIADCSDQPFEWGEADHPDNGSKYRLLAQNRFDTLNQTNAGLQIIEEIDGSGSLIGSTKLEVNIRYLYPSEVFEMVAECGLTVINAYGDFNFSVFTEDSSELIVVASRD